MDEQYCKNIHYRRVQHKRSKQKGRRSACSRGMSQMNCHIPCMLRRKKKSQWPSLSPIKLVRNLCPEESKEQEEVPEKTTYFVDSDCFSPAREPGLTQKFLLQLGWNTNITTSRSSRIICKLTRLQLKNKNIANALLSQSLQVICSQRQNFFLKTVRQMLVLGVEYKSTDSNPAVQMARDIRADTKVAHALSLHIKSWRSKKSWCPKAFPPTKHWNHFCWFAMMWILWKANSSGKLDLAALQVRHIFWCFHAN